MNPAKETQSSKTNHFLNAVKLGLIWGFLFALVESLCSSFSFFPWYRSEGVGLGLEIELLGIAVYASSILALSLIISVILCLAEKSGVLKSTLDHHEEIISAILAWLLVFILLESLAPPLRLWGMFLQAAAFSTVGLFAGVGTAALFEWLKKNRGLENTLLGFSLLLLSGFAFNHLSLTFLIKVKLSVYFLILAVILMALAALIFFWFGWRWMRSEKSALKYSWYAICLILLLSPLSVHERNTPTEIKGRPGNPKNIIVILSDSLRTDAIRVYGGTNSTPNIDRMGREGVIFKNAFSQAPWTLPSVLSAISSLYPSVLQRGRVYRAPDPVTTFPEVLDSYGYFNVLLNGNSALSPASGFTQGFDEYEIYNHFSRTHQRIPLPMMTKLNYLYLRAFDISLFPDLTDTITRKTLKFLDSKKLPEPFFLWLHYMDPHAPYDPPLRFITRKFNTQLHKPFAPNNPWHIRGDYSDPQGDDIRIGMLHLSSEDKGFLHYLYEAEVRYMDEKVGELIRKIKDAGLHNDTLVVFTSDHGEEFWEHEDWGHGQSLYNELIHVPLILWGPGIPPKEIETRVELMDLAPSLLEFLGLPIPDEFQGKSFMPLIRSEPAGARPVFSEATLHFEEMKSILDETHKLIWRQETNRHELYDIAQDKAETMNIYQPDHTAFKRLELDLWPWADENLKLQKDVSGRDPMPAHDEEIKRRLKALGYIK